MSKVIVAGGTGFLGKYLSSKFREKGDEVIIISRSKGDVGWDDQDKLVSAFEGADVVINLAGKSVDCRYNEKIKERFFIQELKLPD